MRLGIFAVIGLVVGLGGGVGYSLTLGGGEPAVTDAGEVSADTIGETHDDSTHAGDLAVADSTAESDGGETASTSSDGLSERIASSLIRIPQRDSAASQPGEAAPEEPVTADSAEALGADAVDETASGGDVAQDSLAVDEPPPVTADQVPPDPAAGAAAVQLSSDDQAGYRRVSRILAAMDADEAAQVLGGLQDSEVRQIITLLPPRTAAAILAELDPARVARLSRGMFKPMGSF